MAADRCRPPRPGAERAVRGPACQCWRPAAVASTTRPGAASDGDLAGMPATLPRRSRRPCQRRPQERSCQRQPLTARQDHGDGPTAQITRLGTADAATRNDQKDAPNGGSRACMGFTVSHRAAACWGYCCQAAAKVRLDHGSGVKPPSLRVPALCPRLKEPTVGPGWVPLTVSSCPDGLAHRTC